MNKRLHTLLGASLAVVVGVGVGGCKDQADDGLQVASSSRNHLVWKRYHATEQDLSLALELAPEELCVELGRFDCVNKVHLTSLGGHEPFGQGLYEPPKEPLVTTPLALDRVALSACGARVERDRQSPVVFTALELDQPAPASDSEAFTRTVDALYRRLLGRDPLETEYERLAELLVDDDGEPIGAAEFAHLACFAVATTSEFSFF